MTLNFARQHAPDYEPEFVFVDYGVTYEIKHIDRDSLYEALKGLARGWDSRTVREIKAGVPHKYNLRCVMLWLNYARAM